MFDLLCIYVHIVALYQYILYEGHNAISFKIFIVRIPYVVAYSI